MRTNRFFLVLVVILCPSLCFGQDYPEWLIESYSAALETEERDVEWAVQIEESVGLLLSDAGFVDASVLCGSKMCRIAVWYNQAALGEGMIDGVLFGASLFGESVSIGAKSENGMIGKVIFVARDGSSLPTLADKEFLGATKRPVDVVDDPTPYESH